MTVFFPMFSPKDKVSIIFLIGFVFLMASQSLPSEDVTNFASYGNALQYAKAQQPSTNGSPPHNNTDQQNKSEIMMDASGHFANNQIKDGAVTWIQGGYWNLQIMDEASKNNNQTGNNSDNNKNKTANFLANFTMIKPDGSLSHNHVINNFSSNNAILSDNDIVVTGIDDIRATNGLEYNQVPLLVHLMGKKVLGLTIDVGKTGGHFASPNEMFGTLISGVGINRSNSTETTMNHQEPIASGQSSNKTSMATMQH
jgi:hypothetical protein